MTTISGTNGSDNITVAATAASTTTVNTGNGNDTVTVGATASSTTIINTATGTASSPQLAKPQPLDGVPFWGDATTGAAAMMDLRADFQGFEL